MKILKVNEVFKEYNKIVRECNDEMAREFDNLTSLELHQYIQETKSLLERRISVMILNWIQLLINKCIS